jgi:hypothetical protein
MTDPRLAGARFSPREIPGGDAAAFVATSFSSMTTAHTAVLSVPGTVETVRALLPGGDGDIEDLGDGRCRVQRGDADLRWLVVRIAALAADTDIVIDGESTPQVVEAIARIANRLAVT